MCFKKYLLAAFFLMLVFCLSACGGKKKDNKEVVTEAPTDDSLEYPYENSEIENPKFSYFKQGTWEELEGTNIVGYYYFSDTKSECKHFSRYGSNVVFSYEKLNNNNYNFHVGEDRNNTYARVIFTDENNAKICWKSERTATLRFVSEKDEAKEKTIERR